MAPEVLRVYWQPGCSSCLQAKELLKRLAIPFESVNVRAQADAMHALARLGLRTVPVVTRGDQYCLAQNLDELAEFVGASVERQRLDVPTLLNRLDTLLDIAVGLTQALPKSALSTPLPGRENRRIIDLAYHVFVIGEAFLDACEGRTLAYEYYERLPGPELASAHGIAEFGRAFVQRLEVWREQHEPVESQRMLSTYFGEQTLHEVLERSCWHIAQHVRQLQSLLEQLEVTVLQPLDDEALAGLPLPSAIWDDEVDMRLQRG